MLSKSEYVFVIPSVNYDTSHIEGPIKPKSEENY